jgi:hypothetical protein
MKEFILNFYIKVDAIKASDKFIVINSTV